MTSLYLKTELDLSPKNIYAQCDYNGLSLDNDIIILVNCFPSLMVHIVILRGLDFC